MSDAEIHASMPTVETANEKQTPVSALDALGIEQADIQAFLAEHDRKPVGREVCLCGHALNKHTEMVPGVISCVTARIWCPCQIPQPVVEVQDTRFFMRTTYGHGPKHALSTGLYALKLRGKWSRLINELTCSRCGAQATNLAPAAVDPSGRVSMRPTARNVLLCPICISDLLGIPPRSPGSHSLLSLVTQFAPDEEVRSSQSDSALSTDTPIETELLRS